MSDLFHREVPAEYIGRILEVMRSTPRDRFQFLTKRADRLEDLSAALPWPPNVWAGVTVEDAKNIWRIDCLRNVAAAVRFLSLEPLLGPLRELDLLGIDWVIVGGESGPKARPIRQEWVVDLRSQCEASGVPFFFKQWGGTNKKAAGRTLQGRAYSQMPTTKGRRMKGQPTRQADLTGACASWLSPSSPCRPARRRRGCPCPWGRSRTRS
jgi:protein gp37